MSRLCGLLCGDSRPQVGVGMGQLVPVADRPLTQLHGPTQKTGKEQTEYERPVGERTARTLDRSWPDLGSPARSQKRNGGGRHERLAWPRAVAVRVDFTLSAVDAQRIFGSGLGTDRSEEEILVAVEADNEACNPPVVQDRNANREPG